MASISLARTSKAGRRKTLTPKEAKFLVVYAKTHNALEAVRVAYPKCTALHEWAYELQQKPHIREKIDQIKQAIIAEADPAYIIREYKQNIETYRDPLDLNRAGHSLKALNGLASYTKDVVPVTIQNNIQVNVGF